MLLKVNKTCEDVFGILSRFIENLLETENLLSSVAVRTKTNLVILKLSFFQFAACSLQGTWDANDVDAPVVSAFSPVSLLVYGDDHSI